MKSKDLKGKRKTDNTWRSISSSENLKDLYASVCPWGLMSSPSNAQLSQPSRKKWKEDFVCIVMDVCLCNPYHRLNIFKAFLTKVLWVLTNSFDTVKKCTLSTIFFTGNQDDPEEILFSLHVRFPASSENYIKPCFSLCSVLFWISFRTTNWMI